MSNYIDSDFNPDTEFWQAFNITNKCPECGFMMNGSTFKPDLLNQPEDCECNKCGHRWSIAIPLGDCIARSEILGLLADEKRFYELRDELRKTINRLHGRSND